jgi:hypothetical protein
VPPGEMPEPGAQIALSFDPARVHRFDAKTEERVA